MDDSPHAPATKRSRIRIDAGAAALVGLAAVLLYARSLGNGFINLDDFQYIIDNAYILHPSWDKLKAFFTEVFHPSTVGGYYQPLTMASLMFDRVLDGLDHGPRPFPFHLTNVLLHGANTAMVYLLLRRFTKATWPAVVVTLLFAAHPMNVESVSWICQRKTLLATLFALGLFLSYDRYVHGGRARWLWFGAAMLVLSLLSKPTSWSLPLALLLLDVWPYRRLSLAAVIEKVPLFAIVGLFGWIVYVSQAESSGLVMPGIVVRPHQTLLVICHNVLFYFYKLVWPVTLCPQYPMPEMDEVRATNPLFLPGIVAVGVLMALVWIARHRPAFFVPIVGYVLLLGPVLGAVQFMGAIAADRFVYLPMIALLISLVWALERVRGATLRPVCVTATVAVAMLFSVKTWAQQLVWKDSMSYWQEVVRQYPQEAGAREGLGSAYLVLDDLDRALAEFHRAIELRPTFSRAYFRIAEVLLLRDKPAEALEWARRGLEQPAADAEGYFFVGLALSRLGRDREAVLPYRQAVEAKPSWREATLNLANCLLRSGDPAASLNVFARANELDPNNPNVLTNWAIALTECGQDPSAWEKLDASLRLRPAEPIALFAYAACSAKLKRMDTAWRALAAAVVLRPDLLSRAAQEARFDEMRKDPRWRTLQDAVRSATTTAPTAVPGSPGVARP